MKNRRKRILGLLLACTMICLPVSQSLAAEYSASSVADGQVLVPGDSLIDIPEEVPLILDGETVASESSGTWTNSTADKVYTAAAAEDGSIQLKTEGYVLIVKNGESLKAEEGADNSWNHFKSQDSEAQDAAFYQSGETVKIKADDPTEGMIFSGWEVDDGAVTVSNPASPETTLVMPEKKVTVTAQYQEVQEETPAPEEPSASEEGGSTDVIDDTWIEPDSGEAAGEPVVVTDSDGNTTDPASGQEEGAWDTQNQDTQNQDTEDAVNQNWEETQNAGNDIMVENIEAEDEEEPAVYNVFVTDGTVSAESGAGPYPAGTYVTVNANDYTGDSLGFSSWSVDSFNIDNIDLYSATIGFTMPEGNVYLTAHYQELEQSDTSVYTYEVIVENGFGSGTYAVGETVTLEAQPDESQNFAGWQTDNEEVVLEDASQPITTFTMPGEAVVVTAEYEAGPDEPDEPVAPADGAGTDETVAPADGADTDETVAPADGAGTDETVAPADGAGTGETVAPADGADTDEPVALADGADTDEPVALADAAGTDETVAPADGADTDEPTGSDTSADPVVSQPIAYTFIINNGTVDSGASVGQDGVYTASAGDTVTISAQTPAGYQFTGWTVAGTYTDTNGGAANIIPADPAAATTTFSIPADATSADGVTITASYEEIPVIAYTIQAANGTVSGAAANSDGTWTVTEGTQIVVTANPAPAGEAFSGWTITDASGNPVDIGVDTSVSSITVIPVQDLIFKANYTGIQYSIAVTNGSANYTTAVGGTTITITASQAPAGMEFDSWTVTSGNISLVDAASSTTTFTMPTANVTVTASYRQKSYTLTVKNGSSDASAYYMDDIPVISANYPDTGKEFAYWEAVSGNVEFDEDYLWQTSFTMPASDVTVKAVYKNGPSTDENQILDIVAGGEYYTGSTIKFTASGAGMDKEGLNPGDYRYRPTGYQIGNVAGSWQSSPYTTSMSIKAVGEYTLKVTFAKEVFDGENWVADGTTDTKSVTFRVVNNTSVATGDETPITTIAVIAGAAFLVFLILLVAVIRRRRR